MRFNYFIEQLHRQQEARQKIVKADTAVEACINMMLEEITYFLASDPTVVRIYPCTNYLTIIRTRPNGEEYTSYLEGQDLLILLENMKNAK